MLHFTMFIVYQISHSCDHNDNTKIAFKFNYIQKKKLEEMFVLIK